MYLEGASVRVPESVTEERPRSAAQEPQLRFLHELPPSLRRSYFRTRAEWYRERQGRPNYHAGRDRFDDPRLVVAALRGSAVIGGARGTVCLPGESRLLPLEHNGGKILYRDLFPQLDLERNGYAEVSKLFAVPDGPRQPFRLASRILEFGMVKCLIDPVVKGEMAAVKYAFCWTRRPLAKPFALMMGRLGMKVEVRPLHSGYLPSELAVVPQRWSILVGDLSPMLARAMKRR